MKRASSTGMRGAARRIALFAAPLFGLVLCACAGPTRFHTTGTASAFVHEDDIYYLIGERKGIRRKTGRDFMMTYYDYTYEYQIAYLVKYSIPGKNVVDARVLACSTGPRDRFEIPTDAAYALVGYRPNGFRPSEDRPQGEGIRYGQGLVEVGQSGGREFHVQGNTDDFRLITPERIQYVLDKPEHGIDCLTTRIVDLKAGRVYFLDCDVPDDGRHYSWYVLFSWEYETGRVTRIDVDEQKVIAAVEGVKRKQLPHLDPDQGADGKRDTGGDPRR